MLQVVNLRKWIIFIIIFLIVLTSISAYSRFNDVWIRGWLNVTNQSAEFVNIIVENLDVSGIFNQLDNNSIIRRWNTSWISNISASNVDRDIPSNCTSGYAVIGWENNLSTTYCQEFPDTTVNNTGFANIGTINTSTACINNSCIDDWSDVNISGNGNGVTGLDTAYDGGENVIDVDTEPIIINLTSDKDFVVQDNGVNTTIFDDTGDVSIKSGRQLYFYNSDNSYNSYIYEGTGTNDDLISINPRSSGTHSFYTGGTSSGDLAANFGTASGGFVYASLEVHPKPGSTPRFKIFPYTDYMWVYNRDEKPLHFESADIMTFAIDNDDDNTGDYFAWYVDYPIGLGTELMKLTEDGILNISGGYGSTGVTIYDNGSLYMNGNLIIDGFCLSEGADCNADIAELTHSKSSADNTTCNIIEEHQETITHNYYNLTEEICEYQLIGEFYYYVCVNVTERYGFNNISEICQNNYELVEDNKYKKVVNCVNETPTWTEEEVITIPRKTECYLDSNFNLEFESGDVVCIDKEDPNHIKFCDKQYDTSVVGAINYNPTLIIGQRAPYPLSLVGNVPVKVICDTPIEIGDLLVSSNTKGYAQSFKSWIPTKPTNLDESWNILKKVWENQGSPFAKALEICNSGNKTIRAWI